jgi:hypothetical protein
MKREALSFQRDKRRFILHLISMVKNDVLRKIPEMPEEWEGFELRQYLADSFDRIRFRMNEKRQADYDNEMQIRNL